MLLSIWQFIEQRISEFDTNPANRKDDLKQADEACPIVFGAAARITIRYDDPKAFDDTEQETEKYDERCRNIAREMLYAFSQINVPIIKKE